MILEMSGMLGRKERDQSELFITGTLRQLVPDDHILARVDRVLDLSWLRKEVGDLYCMDNGRPGIDPDVAVRLMLAGFLLGIVHDRRLLREAQVNIAIRWFVGYGLHELLPDHSSLTRIRQRWGAERFRDIFKRTVTACIAAKIAAGEIVHIDASLIRANVSWDALAVRHVSDVEAANPVEFEWKDRQSGKFKKICTTDPDATMATSSRNRRLEPAYKQHTAVDDLAGVVLDVEVATGEENEGMAIEARLDAIASTTGVDITTATMDAGYAYAKVFRALEDRNIEAIVPAKAEPQPGKVMPTRRFKFDARHNLVRCPIGKILRPKGKLQRGSFQYFHASGNTALPVVNLLVQRIAVARSAGGHRAGQADRVERDHQPEPASAIQDTSWIRPESVLGLVERQPGAGRQGRLHHRQHEILCGLRRAVRLRVHAGGRRLVRARATSPK